jgi:hypothetical protein
VGVLGIPPIAYWAWLIGYAPNWSLLVLTSTAAGLALPNYVAARVMRRPRERELFAARPSGAPERFRDAK